MEAGTDVPMSDESAIVFTPSIAIVLMAAGTASRMGKSNAHKLLAEFDGVPLVRRAALAALGTDATAVVVVTGHRRREIEAALCGLGVTFVENQAYPSGMASSLIAGISEPGVSQSDGMLIMLSDMPGVTTAALDALMTAFRASQGQAVVRASSNGRQGNPVILPRAMAGAVLCRSAMF